MYLSFPNEKDQRLHKFIVDLGEPAVGILDIGTHGARALAAPEVVRTAWPKGTFHLVGDEFALGASVDPSTDILDISNENFGRLVTWIKRRVDTLQKSGVTDISMIGTAVFRWLDNKEEVLGEIKKRTGVDLNIIPEYREAELSILSLPLILEVGDRRLDIKDEDYIVMFDQGGGSTEISWMKWGDRSLAKPSPELRLYDELGTAALRSQFFERNAQGEFVEPERNQTFISTQYKRIQDHVARVASAWRGGPKQKPNTKLHVIGLGSSLSKITPGNGSPGKHLYRLDRAYIEQRKDQSYTDLEAIADSDKQVRSLWRRQQALADDKTREGDRLRERLDESLVKLYGLPAILALLDRCKVDHLYFSGYGLAYGFYIDRYFQQSRPAPPPYEGDQPYVFLSYSHADKPFAFRPIDELQRKGCRIWYDQGMVGGTDWQDTVARKIDKCAAFVVLMSPDANSSDSVFREIRLASNLKKPYIDFRVRAVDQLRPEILMRVGSPIYVTWSPVNRAYLDVLMAKLPQSAK